MIGKALVETVKGDVSIDWNREGVGTRDAASHRQAPSTGRPTNQQEEATGIVLEHVEPSSVGWAERQ